MIALSNGASTYALKHLPSNEVALLNSSLALWLAGLGVPVHWNEPHRPQQNGVVERSQGTTQRWVEPASCTGIAPPRAVSACSA